jgi:transposase
MPQKPRKYKVHLTDDIRCELLSLVNRGEAKARTIKRANILLLSDQGKTASEISKLLHASQQTVYNIRKRFIEEGVGSALNERPRSGVKQCLDTKQEAHVIALACSTPPDGRERWTVRLLTEKVVELGIMEEISRETVRRTLKKTRSNRGKRNDGVFLR